MVYARHQPCLVIAAVLLLVLFMAVAAVAGIREETGSVIEDAIDARHPGPVLHERRARGDGPVGPESDLMDDAVPEVAAIEVAFRIECQPVGARLLGARWPWLMEMHIYYFSHRTLSAMLTKAGFQVLRAEPQGRYLRLGYFATRVSGFSPFLGRKLARVFQTLRLSGQAIPLNFGDLFTAYALKS